ncbi:unannotated protein [freshwater metagenome]|uniref:Unannotated protein n=1 Tax=freshwater metagenome TaxID=449393 RepID=A0A6J7JHR6_9ZZZZ|nr:DUF459 domain-containing protein [Actinomycetota bacterium]
MSDRADDVPPAPGGRHLRARDAVLVVVLAGLLLLAVEGRSVRNNGQEMRGGWERSLVLAVGNPAGWVADKTRLADARDNVLAWVKGEDEASSGGGFANARVTDQAAGAVVPVGVDAFGPRTLGERPPTLAPLERLIVTGDSMAMPLDSEVARALAQGGSKVKVTRDARPGTSISQTDLVDWGAEARQQVRSDKPQAVVFILGANDGFPMPTAAGAQVECCGRDWAAEYATRVRLMMNTYRQAGAARVYWATLPMPRDPERQKITRAVNAAIVAAAQPYLAQVRLIDLSAIFTPGGRYRDAMEVDGRSQIVRDSDGVHLNQLGARIAAEHVLDVVRADYGAQAVPR